MEPVYGIHLGLVVSSDRDPEERNRVQVWIPYLTNTLYKSINAKLKDVTFKGPEDLNLIDPLILKTIQKTLPWAEYAAPMLGGSSGAFNTATGKTATNAGSTLQSEPIPSPTTNSSSLNMAQDGNIQPDKVTPPANATGCDNKKQIPTTKFSFGKNVPGGRDVSSSKEKYGPAGIVQSTNTGFGSSGYQNLGPGVVAANLSNYPIGTILKNCSNGNIYIVGDTYNDPSRNNIDVWYPNEQYDNAYSSGLTKGGQDWSVVATGGEIGKSYQDNLAILSKYTDYGNIPQGQSAAEYLASIGNTGNSVSGIAKADTNINTSGKAPVQHLDNNADVGLFAGNIGVAGSAVGSFSTPNAGTKVWVFFLGGDIQRPVYFAQAPNPSDIAALNS